MPVASLFIAGRTVFGFRFPWNKYYKHTLSCKVYFTSHQPIYIKKGISRVKENFKRVEGGNLLSGVLMCLQHNSGSVSYETVVRQGMQPGKSYDRSSPEVKALLKGQTSCFLLTRISVKSKRNTYSGYYRNNKNKTSNWIFLQWVAARQTNRLPLQLVSE